MEGNNHVYVVELLNNKTVSDMPAHILNVKKGTVILVLLNLNTIRGFCSGTRLIHKKWKSYLFIAEISTGTVKVEIVFIPRIDLCPTFLTCDFNWRNDNFLSNLHLQWSLRNFKDKWYNLLAFICYLLHLAMCSCM